MQEAAKRAEELFRSGYSCAQAIFAALSGGAVEDATALRIASAFGGGMARRGDTCGAVTGALMVIGLLHGRERAGDDDTQETTYRLAEEFLARFAERNGSLLCRDIIGFDPSSAAGRRRFSEDPELVAHCAAVVREAAVLLAEILAGAQPERR